jgi:flagellar hook protein FlgE
MMDFSIPLAGLNQAASSLDKAAAKLAKAGFSPEGDTVDVSAVMVNLMQVRNDFGANLKVIRTQDEMTKNLLNTLG